jgi:hypothetical protein
MSRRATPFYCPYCGETEISPRGSGDEWHCDVCDRVFEVVLKATAPEKADRTVS